MTKILIVDDDRELSDIVTFALNRAEFEVVSASDGEQAIRLFHEARPELVLLDYNLPRLDGLETCRRLRAFSSVPIIMLTVRNAEEDILRAFDAGADDYVTKPFSPKQLIARIRAELRRAGSAPQTIAAGDLLLDPVRQEVSRRGESPVGLTPLEFRLLHVLAQRRGQVLDAAALVQHVWGHEDNVGDRTLLKGLVRRVRQKLDTNPSRASLIVNVPGQGYALRE